MIYTITQGGPGIASETLYLYSYTVGFNFFKTGIGAAATLIVLPVSIFAFFVRKSIVQGLTMGAMKD